MKQLQLNQEYKTVIGAKVTLSSFDEDRIHQFFGKIEYMDALLHTPKKVSHPIGYTPYGKSNRTIRGFDIIGEWDNSELPQFKHEETPFSGSVLEKEINLRMSASRKVELKKWVENILAERSSVFWKDALELLSK